MTAIPSNARSQLETSFLGLAPFLRTSIAGSDLRPIGREMLATAECNPDDANLWMNLSVAMQCIGQRELGLQMQGQALELTRIFHLPAWRQPARLRLLVLTAPGDIAENTPIDCLLEHSDIDLIFYYVSSPELLRHPVPEHDVLMVAASDSDRSRDLLGSLGQMLADWPRPVINSPRHIPATGRDVASVLLQDAPGLLIPPTLRIARPDVEDLASGKANPSDHFPAHDFPIILRPVGSQAGRDLDRLHGPEDLAAYLAKVGAEEFFISRFIDYSGEDGLFRKYRIALIDGKPYACHMAVSSNWMVHYVNAGMYEEAQKRDEERAFMEHFDDFARRHHAALDAVYRRTKLDYLCIDCAETRDGELLIFEIDHTMVVHAMDPEELFPYKQVHMQKVKQAFRDYLFRLGTA